MLASKSGGSSGCSDASRLEISKIHADALDLGQMRQLAPAHAVDAVREEQAGQLDRILPRDAGAQDHGQELGVRQRRSAMHHHPFARPLRARHVPNHVSHRCHLQLRRQL
jgi:hypothetical protein